MSRASFFSLVAVFAVAAGCSESQSTGAAGGSGAASKSIELLNVSYDPTRELWREINEKFIPEYEKKANVKLAINQTYKLRDAAQAHHDLQDRKTTGSTVFTV